MKEKLLFVSSNLSTFILLDIKILSENFEVETNFYNWKNKKLTPIFLIKQFFYLLFNTHRFSYIIVSFGGYWSFLPTLFGKLFRKKTFVILHGTDCTAFEEINYGSLRKQPLRIFCKWSYILAYKLLPVSRTLIYTENTYYKKNRVIRQGYKYFFPKIKTPSEAIANGFEIEKWVEENDIRREEKTFITVASGNTIYLKGIDLILEVSKKFTDCKFIIAGFEDSERKFKSYNNVYFLGRISQTKLKQLFYSSKYYLQLSITEGFVCSLCEAMLCGCIPIGSNVNEIPEVIDNTGYILKNRDSMQFAELLQHIFEKNINLPNAAKQIIENYPIEKRKQRLKDVISGDVK